MSRPLSLQYAREDTPPLKVMVLSGLQHNAILIGVGLVLPILVLSKGALDPTAVHRYLGLALIGLAVSTILQIQRGRIMGSGYLAPATFAVAYLPASLSAMEQGGPSLVMGMLIFAGLVQMAVAPALRRLRPYLPPEIGGLAVLMIGLILGLLGLRLLADHEPTVSVDTADATLVWIGVLCLTVTVAVNVWATGSVRLYATLLGLAAGSAGAVAVGAIDGLAIVDGVINQGVLLPLPPLVVPSFDPMLAPEFVISAVACSLRAMGDIITCQKIEDTQWVRPDLGPIRGGILADGLGTAIAAALGCPIGLNTFSGSIGLAAATGVTARRIGFFIAGWLLLIAMLPGVLAFFVAIPRPVMGGVLLFAATFIVFNGIQVIMSRLLDGRRILMLGIALILGLSRDVFPTFYDGLPGVVAALTNSPLMIAVGTALALNLLFRLGVARTAAVTLPAADLSPVSLEAWVHEQGSRWGARVDVMRAVVRGLTEVVEARNELMDADTEVRIDLGFDEYHVDVQLTYVGRPMALAAADPIDAGDLDALDPDATEARVRALLIRHLADQVSARCDRKGRQVITMRFEH